MSRGDQENMNSDEDPQGSLKIEPPGNFSKSHNVP